MERPLKILLLEDSEDDALLVLYELKKAGYRPQFERVDTRQGFVNALGNGAWDVITADYSLPGFDGLTALSLVQQRGFDIPFIIVSGKIGEELAAQTMRSGAHDYIMKNNLKRLVPTIERQIREQEIRRQKRAAEAERRQIEELSQALNDINVAINSTLDSKEIMRRVLNEAQKALGTESSLILLYQDNSWVAHYAYGDISGAFDVHFSDAEIPFGVSVARSKKVASINSSVDGKRVTQRCSGAMMSNRRLSFR